MKKKVMIIIGVILIIGLIVLGVLNYNSSNKKELIETKSLVTIQQEYEKDFKVEGYTFDQPNVILDPYHNSPLTALVLFETEEEISPTVIIPGKDENTTYTNTFDRGTKHYLPIYGLYPGEENKITISYRTESGEEHSKTISIQTESLPEDFILPTKVVAQKEKLGNDLYFFTPSSQGYTCAYDVNGDVRWYLSNYALWDNTRLANGHMLISTERLVNNPYYMTGLYEIDLLGKIYVEYSLPGGYHHDYDELPNGNLLVASNDFNNEDGTVEDYIVELDRNTGKIVKTFDLKDVLNMEDGQSENWSSYDWFHNNSVWYDEKTNSITLSGRHQDAVINLNYEDGSLNWIIGDPTNWSEEYQKYFFTPIGDDFEWQWSQHAAMITPEGYVFVLDNGNNKSKKKEEYVPAESSYTRGVMYKIDTENKTIEQIWQYGKERGSEFYSPYISDVDYLEAGHYIVHSGGIVYVDGKNSNQPAGLGGADRLVSDTVELLQDEVIFELVLPTNNYRVEKMSLYNDSTYSMGRAKRLGSLGKTDITKRTFGPIHNAVDPDDNYQSHQIKFTKEEDRLVFTGQFKRENDVKIILYQNLMANYYEIRITKRPYTALCLDIFTEEENENGIVITRYINQEGLSGKYSIYLEIDGKIYNTKEYIQF